MRVIPLLLALTLLGTFTLAAATPPPPPPPSAATILRFVKTSIGQLQYIFSDNIDCVAALGTFYSDFSLQAKKIPGLGTAQAATIGNPDLVLDSSASITSNSASATSSDTYTSNRTLIIAGSNGQFVLNPTSSSQDSLRVYNIGEVMIQGVVAFVEVQASLLRNGNYFIDAKINEQNDGFKTNKDGTFLDSKTVSRKVVQYNNGFAFGASEIYVVNMGATSVDFWMYTVASALNLQATEIISSVIIDIKHLLISSTGSISVEQATLTSTSDCNFESICTVVNLGSIKVNGELLSKLVQAEAISGANFEKQVAMVGQMYSENMTAINS